MAQNITLQGASYTDVPAVNLPKTGGGTAQFTDTSDTTATASQVFSGYYFYSSAGVKTQGTASSSGGDLIEGTYNLAAGTHELLPVGSETYLEYPDSFFDSIGSSVGIKNITWTKSLVVGDTYHIVAEFNRAGKSRINDIEGTFTFSSYPITVKTDITATSESWDGRDYLKIYSDRVECPWGEEDLQSKSSILIDKTGATHDGFSKVTVTVDSAAHANPSVVVEQSTGVINATHTQTTGYVTGGTTYASTSLAAVSATTYHPSTTDQTIAQYKYLTGVQTIKAVTTSNLSASNILSGVTIKIGDSTDDDCVASVTGSVVIQHYYTGSSVPSAGLGVNGDIYLKTS